MVPSLPIVGAAKTAPLVMVNFHFRVPSGLIAYSAPSSEPM